MPFSFAFDGKFFDMEKFVRALAAYITIKPAGASIDVKGRLLTIDGIALQASPQGFPRVKASVAATAYLLPADQGLTGGATPTKPAGATSTATAAIAGETK
jgi:hypothetical protein